MKTSWIWFAGFLTGKKFQIKTILICKFSDNKTRIFSNKYTIPEDSNNCFDKKTMNYELHNFFNRFAVDNQYIESGRVLDSEARVVQALCSCRRRPRR